ncbi:hypothetical protein Adt_25262 [Abeliophyllum distichum]|uniref:Precursor of CEP9 n=1 Tax=Abeliophyllum distichum TaxID=126358 RepID=A0ABD1SG50_9LAMI
MAFIQNISLFLLLLAGFSSLQISLTEARQLKALKKQEKHDFPDTAPANDSPHVVGQKRIPPPKEKDKIDSSEELDVGGFRPTAPGKSPGIGHSFAAQRHNVAGKTDDFRPTGPSHSPGIGHSFAKKTTGPNA